MDVRMLFDELLAADTEAEVTGVLERFNLADYTDEHWVPSGGWDNANNEGAIGSQQADARAALVEKVVNSIDAMLTRACWEHGLDPSSSDAPKSMEEAADRFFDVPNGRLALLPTPNRTVLGQNIVVAVSGLKQPDYPCVIVADRGEGQRPNDFGQTFLSLNKNNKVNIAFVQGKFNQGGAGVLPYCSKRYKYQLIISRRHPSIKPNEQWGFTLVRRWPPVEGEEKNYRYEYLVDQAERVFTLPPKPLDIWPARDGDRSMEGGTLMKLYEYQIRERSMAQTHLYYALSRRLYRPVLPVRIVEMRDYAGHSLETTLAGMEVRLEEDTRGVLESRFSGEMSIKGLGKVSLGIALFRSSVTSEQMRRYVQNKEAVLFTLNGQTHHTESRVFLQGPRVKLKALSPHLLVEVNCSELPRAVTAELFTTSRDRIRECEEGEKLIVQLQAFLRDNHQLRQANEQRRREKLQKSTESKEIIELFNNMIRNNPDLANILQGKGELVDPTTVGDAEEEFKGRRYPTYLRLPEKLPPPFIKQCPRGSKCKVVLETDAQNEYLSRAHDPGELVVRVDGFDYRRALNNGKLTLTFEPHDTAEVGHTCQVSLRLSSPEALTGWLQEQFHLQVAPTGVTKKRPQGDGTGGARPIALPKPVPVTRDQWDERGWTGEDVVEVDTDGEPAISYVNVDNTYLRRYQHANADDAEVLRQQFMIGATLIGLVLETAIDNGNGAFHSEHTKVATQQIGKILLPIVNSLGKDRLEGFD